MSFSKKTGALLVACCALIAGMAPAKAGIQTIKDSNSEIWGSAGTSLFNYQELIGRPTLQDSEHGWNPTLAAGIDYMSAKSNWYSALEFSDSFGNVHYNGSVFDAGTGFFDIPYQSSSAYNTNTIDGKFGKGFAFGHYFMLTPYGELGYRHWGRKLSASQTENYDNYDFLGGVMFQVAPTNRLVLTTYASAGQTFAATMKTGGQNYALGGAGMYKLGAKVGFDLTRKIELFTTLDYDAYRYIQSPAQLDGSYEPTSKTEDTTLRVGIGYHFGS